MLDIEYQLFFDLILDFKQLQDQQKQRGLNDYNILNVVRDEYAEVGLHSRVLYSLLDPEGFHYQKDLFLKLFIKEVLKIPDFGDMASILVEREEQTKEARRIDFTIKNTKYYIGIEMKLNAADGTNQLFDYESDLKKKADLDNKQPVIIYYLSLKGGEAKPNSSNGVNYESISFEKDILSWIIKCQHEVHNITNLNQAFENYKWIVQKITKKYRSQVMSFEEFLENNKGQINEETIKNVLNEIDALQEYTNQNFINELAKICIPKGFYKIESQPHAIQKDYDYFSIKVLTNLAKKECCIQIFSKKKLEETEKNNYLKKIQEKIQDRILKNNNFDYPRDLLYGIIQFNYNKKINFQNKDLLLTSIEKDLEILEEIL